MGRDIASLERPHDSMPEMHEWVDHQFGSDFAGPQERLKAFETTIVQPRYDGVTRLKVGEDVWPNFVREQRSRPTDIQPRQHPWIVAPDIEIGNIAALLGGT